jgi:IMP dehydrogenase/GMP reductase
MIKGLTYTDVSIRPAKFSRIESRNDVILTTRVTKNYFINVATPIAKNVNYPQVLFKETCQIIPKAFHI